MTIVVTGGGSGGHITPVLAVAHELKKQSKDIKVVYIGQKGDNLSDIPAQSEFIDEIHLIRAGKLRRYHGEGLKQLLDLKTVAKNIRDAVLVAIGIVQTFFLLKKIQPDTIFIKGGFVGVPVGLAAAALHIPYVTHDSDALPGLANRIVAPWARLHAVALPKEVYSYPADKTLDVGVPLAHHYKPFSPAEVKTAREQLGLPKTGKVLFITGGGLGAQRLNKAVATCAADLLQRYPDLTILQLAGRANEATLRQYYQKELSPKLQHRVIVKGFVTNLHVYSGAADVVVTRAGATSIAEFAAQHKACVVVPNPLLTGGHQTKNAKVLADRMAVKLVTEDKLAKDERALLPVLVDLFDHPERAADLGKTLGQFAKGDSAKQLAMVLLDIAGDKK
ncbi:MAG TPA: UDP-N-acetylglucosamine--N-acetylmuramyl-(pentapeptide) pyrophosphoryl-undecaprenol N-acetylglucosamine transferase [Candidatus Saccharimonadales bacterium]|nr:UDP-N-acetylglucosamine--N-acetylmuramyl-(pentapeptide) pyrophosphoryl-undecaprenol N-acetylglucosamine transferase [Candidatus Saccharimonadales bacterium]